jgi:hypothetical protein
MAAAIKMDELLVSWIGSDSVYENVLELINKYKQTEDQQQQQQQEPAKRPDSEASDKIAESSPRQVNDPSIIIPPFYPLQHGGKRFPKRKTPPRQNDAWEPLQLDNSNENKPKNTMQEDPTMADEDGIEATSAEFGLPSSMCVRDQVHMIYREHSEAETPDALSVEAFVRITKEVCHFPSFFNPPLYGRILALYNAAHSDHQRPKELITLDVFEWYWKTEMEPYDDHERFFRLLKQPNADCIVRNDFLPYINALLNDHPVSAYYYDAGSVFLHCLII